MDQNQADRYLDLLHQCLADTEQAFTAPDLASNARYAFFLERGRRADKFARMALDKICSWAGQTYDAWPHHDRPHQGRFLEDAEAAWKTAIAAKKCVETLGRLVMAKGYEFDRGQGYDTPELLTVGDELTEFGLKWPVNKPWRAEKIIRRDTVGAGDVGPSRFDFYPDCHYCSPFGLCDC